MTRLLARAARHPRPAPPTRYVITMQDDCENATVRLGGRTFCVGRNRAVAKLGIPALPRSLRLVGVALAAAAEYLACGVAE